MKPAAGSTEPTNSKTLLEVPTPLRAKGPKHEADAGESEGSARDERKSQQTSHPHPKNKSPVSTTAMLTGLLVFRIWRTIVPTRLCMQGKNLHTRCQRVAKARAKQRL